MDVMNTVPDGYKRDALGRLVPLAVIKAEHLLEDELVLAMFGDPCRPGECLVHADLL